MQVIRATSTAALCLLIATMVPAYAKDKPNEKQGKPDKHQDGQQQGAPPPTQQQGPQKGLQHGQPAQQSQQANRDIALGRGNWTFFGSDSGGKTAAVLRSFVASCKRCGVEPFAWFRDVLSRIPAHSITRLSELLPHNWQPATSPAEG